jgi:ABC-type nitrate/sulfonate/bicarbonate transport system substrate-binding protein
MFEWFARQQGVDMSKIALINTAPPGLLGYALADRAAGIHIWDPGYTTLMQKNPSLRSLDLDIHQSWEKFTGTRSIPYLGVAAHTEWVEKNPQLVPKLYATYKDAVDWTLANPDEASSIIISTGTANEQKAVADLIRANDRLGLNIQWAADLRKELLSVYRVGREMGILPSEPGPETIYTPHAK